MSYNDLLSTDSKTDQNNDRDNFVKLLKDFDKESTLQEDQVGSETHAGTKLKTSPLHQENLIEDIQQWWMGKVLEVSEEDQSFTAVLTDLQGRETGVEFDFNIVPNHSEHLIKPNNQFAYYISRTDKDGTRRNNSQLEFSETSFGMPFNSIEELDNLVDELFDKESD